MQWLIAFICACICFAIFSNLQKKSKDEENENENENKNKMILFFFIVLIFQIVFYYFDIVSFFKSSQSISMTKPPIENDPLPHFSRTQQEYFEKEILRNIHQDINVGYPDF